MKKPSHRLAYVNLVERLLDRAGAPDNEITSILKEHIDLFDLDLLEVMYEVAEQKKGQNRKEDAMWLLKFRVELARSIGVTDLRPFENEATDVSYETAYSFFAQVFSLISESPLAPQSARNFIAQNADRLNEQLVKEFLPVTGEMMKGVDGEEASFRSMVIATFGNLIRELLDGDRDIKQELTIAAYEQAVRVMDYEATPDEWAEVNTQLVFMLCFRKRGNHSENIEHAITCAQKALKLIENKIEPTQWAGLKTILGIAYLERIEGDRSDNLERAISLFTQVTQTIDSKALPEDWGDAMGGLANTYRIRIQGDRASNIEAAIRAYQQALEVLVDSGIQTKWVQVKTNLAATYNDRLKGDHATNIEAAIALYTQLLKTVKRDAMPLQWAAITANLGLAYRNRIRGNHADNIEQAINAYRLSLEVNTRQAMPAEWAEATNNLAAALQNRIRGDRAENIEQAIETYQSALQVTTQGDNPVKWAQLTANLASAYRQRVRFEPSSNTEQAIGLYHQALQVFTQYNRERERTMTLGNLAAALMSIRQENSDSNLEQAIAIYEKLLDNVQDMPPIERSRAMFNLANAYVDRKGGSRTDDISRAIALNVQALEQVTGEEMPILQAKGLYNLATAYLEQQGTSERNMTLVIDCCQKALAIAGPYQAPADCQKTSRLLGDLYFDRHHWSEAVAAYNIAIESADILYQSSLLRENQQVELVMTGDLFHRRAFAQAKIGESKSAVVSLEQGRTRSLNDSLARDISKLARLKEIAPTVYSQYEQAIEALQQLETDDRTLELVGSRKLESLSLSELRDRANTTRKAFQQSVQAIQKQPGYEHFLTLPSWDHVQAATVSEQAVVYMVVTSQGGLALVVSNKPGLLVDSLWLKDLSESFIRPLLFAEGNHSPGWFKAYEKQSENGQLWRQTIEKVTSQLWRSLMSPLVSYLLGLHCTEATLIPTGYLSFLPLHAAWTEAPQRRSRCYALDSIQFKYSPSAQALQASRENHTSQMQRSEEALNSFLAINEPARTGGNPLPNSTLEINSGLRYFKHSDILKHNSATRTNVLNSLSSHDVIHFACHGLANIEEPLKSGLMMADNTILTLSDLLNFELKNIRLAILSACETGLPGAQLPDEAISLSSGMVQAGAVGVVASLWQVPDISTMLLISRFYQLWREQTLPPSEALVQAQRWLKESKSEALRTHCEAFIPELSFPAHEMPKAITNLQRALKMLDFSEPYHWAAFTYVGV